MVLDLPPPKPRRKRRVKEKVAVGRSAFASIGSKQESVHMEKLADTSTGRCQVPLLRSRPASSLRTAVITTTKRCDHARAALLRSRPWSRAEPPRALVARRPTM